MEFLKLWAENFIATLTLVGIFVAIVGIGVVPVILLTDAGLQEFAVGWMVVYGIALMSFSVTLEGSD